MKDTIIKKVQQGKRLTKKQVAWVRQVVDKYDDDCEVCFFNLCIYLGINPGLLSETEHAKPKTR